MSGFGFVAEVVTPSGQYRHLIAPTTAGRLADATISPACGRVGRYGGTWRVRQWDHRTGEWEADPRPVCPTCLDRWHRWVAWQVRTVTRRLDDLAPAHRPSGDLPVLDWRCPHDDQPCSRTCATECARLTE